MAVNGWYLLSRFALTPFILEYLTLAEYGLWSLCFVVVSYLAFTSMGFEGTYIKYVADFNARDEKDRINRLLSTGLILTSILALGLLLLLLFSMELLFSVLRIDLALQDKAAFVLMGTAVVFMLDISFNCFARALDGLQYLALTAKIRFWSSCFELVLIVILLIAGYGIYGLMLAFLVRYLLVIGTNVWFAYRLIPNLRVRLKYFDIPSLKILASYGGRMQILGLIGIVMTTFDRLIITSLLGLQATGLYEVGKKMPVKGARIPAEISGAIMPALSHLNGTDNLVDARRLFLGASRYMAMLSSPFFTYLAACAPYAIHVWLGPGYGGAVPVLVIIAMMTLVHLLTGASSGAARGLGKLGWELRYSLLNLVLGVILTPLLALKSGLTGAALGVAIATSISSIYFLRLTHTFFGVSLGEYCKTVLHPFVIPFFPAVGFHLFFSALLSTAEISRFSLFLVLLTGAVAHCLISGLILAATGGVTFVEKQKIKEVADKRLIPAWRLLVSITWR